MSVTAVRYFGRPHGASETALLSVAELSCGVSCSEAGDILIFRLWKGRLLETQQIGFDLQAPGAGVDFSSENGILTVKARHEDNSAHCCPDKLDVATFKWDGKTFRLQSLNVQPVKQSDY